MNKTPATSERLTLSRDQLRQALRRCSDPAGGAQVRLLAKAACGAVATVARNQPLAAVMGAAVVGALLVRTRAWRWLPVSALFATLVPPLVKAFAFPEKS